MSDHPTKELDVLFSLQLSRIRDKLNPIPIHSTGPRKPSLEETEYKLLQPPSLEAEQEDE